MKVECIQLINPITGDVEDMSNWLTVGKLYIVLSLIAVPGRDILLRLSTDDQSPALFKATQFRTMCSKIPSNWVAELDNRGVFSLAPEKWLRSGFWEDYFNGVSSAEADFNEEKWKIFFEAGC